MTPVPLSAIELERAARDFLDHVAKEKAERVLQYKPEDRELALRDMYRELSLANRSFVERWAANISAVFGPETTISIRERQEGPPGAWIIRALQGGVAGAPELGCEVILDEPNRFVSRMLDLHVERSAKP